MVWGQLGVFARPYRRTIPALTQEPKSLNLNYLAYIAVWRGQGFQLLSLFLNS